MAEAASTANVYCWGRGDSGQLGLGSLYEDPAVLSPKPLPKLQWSQSGSDSAIVAGVVGGADHSVLLTNDGRIFTCGSNDFKQLGHQKMQSRFEQVNALEAYNIRSVACGARHTIALDEWGKVFSWGQDDKGQCGHNSENDNWPEPKMIRGLGTVTVVQVACGSQHSIALTNAGKLFVFGDNSHGQLGLGPNSEDRSLTPQPMESLGGLPIRCIAAGGDHTVVIGWSGAVYAWGRNHAGQLGFGTLDNQYVPRQIRPLRSQRVCYVACGKEHTVCLTDDGGVFTFGSGAYGQLGHGTKSNESLPRKVIELMGTEVSQIACGNRHTLAFIPSRRRLYAFGLGGSGQLGWNTTNSSTTPQVVQGPWLGLDSEPSSTLYLIGAGGDQSFCCSRTKADTAKRVTRDQRDIDPAKTIKMLTPKMLETISATSKDGMADQDFLESLETIFRSRACLNASLISESHRPCTSRNSGLDVDAWLKAYAVIQKCEHDTVQEAILSSIVQFVIPELNRKAPDVETLRIYLTLPLYHGFQDPSLHMDLHTPYARCIMDMETNAWNIVERWFAGQNATYLKPVVARFKGVVVYLMEQRKKATSTRLSSLTRSLEMNLYLLKILNRINVEHNLTIDYEEFCIPEVNELFELPQCYARWLHHKSMAGRSSDFFICNYPFVFDANAKTTLLEVDQTLQMQMAVDDAQRKALMTHLLQPQMHIDPEHMTFLMFVINRNNLLQDTLTQIQAISASDLKKPMRVQFIGEDAEDAGGVRKEFFLLLMRELLDPKYGMFKEYEETRTIWFRKHCFEDNLMFFLVGVICGLAIYNFTIVNMPFPLPLYKKLLSNKVESTGDLEALSPTIAQSLRELLKYSGDDVEDVFCLNFTITEDKFGATEVIALKEGGKDIPVTSQNKDEYVRLYIDYILNTSVKTKYDAFHQGFHRVCGGRVLDLFHARELMTLVVGKDSYDWEDFEASAQYKNGYDKDHPTIKHFWSVFHELSESDKRQFLLFLTGCDRIPILGMRSLKLTIQRTGDDNFLPVAHTCFNLLDLPPYATKEKLRYKLLKAIQHAEGFGLA